MELINSMKNRELERKLNLQKKQTSKKSVLAENEQMDFFQRTFNEKQNLIESLLKKAQNLPKNELPEHFNNISKEILQLQKYVAASSLFLKHYFLQKCQNSLQELNLRAQELESDLLPKKRFGFKNKSKTNAKIEKKSEDIVDFAEKSNNLLLEGKIIDCGFYKKSNEILCLEGPEIEKKDVSLEHLDNCKVYLKGHPSTLHLSRLNNCEIFSGPVSTSIFAENCLDSTLVIACQQLRLHASKNISIYLHVTSRAIMEDCSDIAITSYNWNYEGIEKDFISAGLDRNVNNWRCVDDFNWLNAERHSPNWREMDEDNIIKEWS